MFEVRALSKPQEAGTLERRYFSVAVDKRPDR